MPVGRLRQLRQYHIIRRNIGQLVIISIIEMMMMINIRIKNTMLVMQRDATKQPGFGELVQCIIDSAASYMRSGLGNFGGQLFGGHMPMTTIKQQGGDRNALACWA